MFEKIFPSMRKDTEIQQGKLNNLEQIENIVEQMLTKEVQGNN